MGTDNGWYSLQTAEPKSDYFPEQQLIPLTSQVHLVTHKKDLSRLPCVEYTMVLAVLSIKKESPL